MKKILTREQAQTSKDRAARFVLNVLRDTDGAQAIEDESLDDWVERKKITLRNPQRRKRQLITERKTNMAAKKPTMAEVLEENKRLKDENEDLNDQLDELSDQLDQISDIAGGDEDDDDQDQEDDEDGDDDQD